MACFLAHDRKKFLYEIRPDVFPAGYVTDLEIGVWDLFYADLLERKEKLQETKDKIKNG